MKSPLLSALRWTLIVLLSASLLYLAFISAPTIITTAWQMTGDLSKIGSLLFIIVITVFLGSFPSVMLYSLVTKKLYGFASALGAILALAICYFASTLTQKVTTLKMWDLSFLPFPTGGFLVIPALLLSISLFILPFWALFRMIRLTNEWIYPKLLKPLEEKI